jgi:hypothetical protein
VNDELKEMVRQIAAEHGVALDRGDPILVLQTATRMIVQGALQEAQQSLGEAMARHRSELELAATKWQADSKRTASQLIQEVQTAIAASVARELDQTSRTASAQLTPALSRHEKALARSTVAFALAAAVSLLAAAASVWASRGPSERPESGAQTACVAAAAATARWRTAESQPKDCLACR